MSWLDGSCTTQLFGVPCFWIARAAKIGQFLSALVIIVEIIGKDRVEASGVQLRGLLRELSQSGWVQKQQKRRLWLIDLIAVVFFLLGVLKVLPWVGINLPTPLVSMIALATSIILIMMIVIQWMNILLMLVDRGTHMIERTLERSRLSTLITISAFIVLVISFILDLAVS